MNSTAPCNTISSKAKILLVDDDPTVTLLINQYLKEEGYEVITASTGEEAWQLLTTSRHNFATLITDRMMPGMDGTELARRIQKQPAFKQLPVIMITSQAEKDEKIAAYQGGVFDFLMKPIEKDLLLWVLKRALMVVA